MEVTNALYSAQSQVEKSIWFLFFVAGQVLARSKAAITRGLRRPCNTAIMARGFFVWCVRDHIIAHYLKTQRSNRQVGTAVANMGKRNKGLDRFIDFFADAICRVETVGCDIFPDFFQIFAGCRMKNEFAHE